jgi:hypothetical protein
MPSTTQIPFLTHDCEDSLDVVEYIRIAAELLDTMYSELRSLSVEARQFARAICSHEPEMLARTIRKKSES